MVKVSIILPIYNVAPYLEETFESIVHQSLKEIEIIAVNDGSTDNSEEIIRKYRQRDSRIIAVALTIDTMDAVGFRSLEVITCTICFAALLVFISINSAYFSCSVFFAIFYEFLNNLA